jgi:hypothetical protein
VANTERIDSLEKGMTHIPGRIGRMVEDFILILRRAHNLKVIVFLEFSI